MLAIPSANEIDEGKRKHEIRDGMGEGCRD
jgi:hypothetical protein